MPSRPTRVAVVIACHDMGRTLEDAVDSVMGQSRAPTEVVLVDDGSTDTRTRQVLARTRRPRLTTLLRPHGGVSIARNRGVELTSTPFVVLLDADDLLHPEAIDRMAGTLEAHRDVDFVSCEVQAFEGASYRWRPPAISATGTLARGSVHISTMFRRRLWQSTGGFDPELIGYEDLDFWLRAIRLGFKGVILDAPLLYYRVRPGSRYRAVLEKDAYARTMAALVARHRSLFEEQGLEVLRQKQAFVLEVRQHNRWLRERRDDLARQLPGRWNDTAESPARFRGVGDPARTEPPAWADAPLKHAVQAFLAETRFCIRGRVAIVSDQRWALPAITLPSDVRGEVVRMSLADLTAGAAAEVDTIVAVLFTADAIVGDAVPLLTAPVRRGGGLVLAVPGLGVGPRFAETRDEEPAGERLLRRALGECVELSSFDVQTTSAGLLTALVQRRDPVRLAGTWVRRATTPLPRRSSGLVLMYHRVAVLRPDSHGLCVSPDDFIAQMHFLHDTCTVMPLEDLVAAAREDALPPRAVSLTFDDGYLDALTTAAPVLRALGLPATFFVNTEDLEAEHEAWHDIVERLLLGPAPFPSSFVLDDGARTVLPTSTENERRALLFALHGQLLRAGVEARREIVSRLAAWSGRPQAVRRDRRVLLASEVRALAEISGCEVGSHTVHHLWLPHHPEPIQRQEMATAKAALESLLERSVTSVAYPYGAYDERTARLAGELHRVGVTVDPGRVTPSTDAFRVPRVQIPALPLRGFATWLQDRLGEADSGTTHRDLDAAVPPRAIGAGWLDPDPIDSRERARAVNAELSRDEVTRQATVLQSRPQFVIVDPTSKCNARCVMCPVSFRPPGDLGRDLDDGVVDRLHPTLAVAAHVNLFSTGEPTIARRIERLVRHVTATTGPHAVVWVSTNGKAVSSAFLDCFDSPRVGLQFSVDGGTEEVFERIRRGIRFEQLVSSLERAAARRDASGYPRLAFSSTISKRNLHDLTNIFRLARRFGVEHVHFYDEDPEVPEEEPFVLDESDRPLFEDQRASIEELGVAYSNGLHFRGYGGLRASEPPSPDPAPALRCVAPWRVFHQRADGTVRTCCTLRRSMGDLSTQTFEEVWNGPEYVALRQAFVSQRGIPGTCYRCTDPLRTWGE